MSAATLMRFNLHVRCEGCVRMSVLPLDVPNVEGAPQTVDELMATNLIDYQPFKCRDCDSEICTLVTVNPFQHKDAEEMTKRPATDAARVTIYVVQGYRRDRHGRLRRDEAIRMPSEAVARRRAERYAEEGGGAIATAQEGSPELGDWDEARVIVQVGPVTRDAFNDMDEVA